jgi:hypothetical protein
MTAKAIAPRFNDGELAKIHMLASAKGISDTEAVKLAVKRYFMLPQSSVMRLEAKERWIRHRNIGFRRLTSFASEAPAKISFLSSKSPPARKTAKS